MHVIGPWQFDPKAGSLRGQGLEKSLEERSARVLEILCLRRGEAVSKDELLNAVWQGRSVSSNSVAIVIGDLRRALNDSASEPAYILTVGKRGYRLTLEPQNVALVAETGHGWRRSSLMACAVLFVLAAVTTVLIRTREDAPIDVLVAPVRNETGQTRYDELAQSLTAVVTDRVVHLHRVRVLSSDGRAPVPGHRISLSSKLIIWNGAPELAVTAIDAASQSVLWSTFATEGAGNLARDTAVKLAALQRPVDRYGRRPE